MKIKLAVLFCSISLLLFSETSKKDSLLVLLEKNQNYDTTRVKNLNSLVRYYLLEENNIDEALKTCGEAIEVAQKSKSQFWLGKAHSLNAYIKSNYTPDFKGAIDSYFSALKCFENTNSLSDIYTVYLNLGGAFYQYKELNNANTYFKKAEKIALTLNNESDLVSIYTNLGGVNEALNNDSIALTYYNKAKLHCTSPDSELDLAIIDFDIASLQIQEDKESDNSTRSEAIKVFRKTKDVFKKYEAANYYLSNVVSLGRELTKLNELAEGKDLLKEAEKLALEIRDYVNLILIYDGLAQNAQLRGDVADERDHLKSYILYNDSLFQESKSKAITELQTKYETEKKEQENLLLSKENEKKQLGIYFSIGGLFLLGGLMFMIYRNSRQKTKANTLLSAQKEIIEDQNKSITDSIKYAQRIQGAILPPDKMWFSIFPKSFVLYKPKDILSGDFYWTEETEDWKFAAAADCTGHGVPGALMSIVNFNLLNRAVLEKKLTMPGEILDSVNESLTQALHQTYHESVVKDGMDITLIAINKKTNEVYFAGANNPVYIFNSNGEQEHKGDKFPVGAFVGEEIHSFATKKLTIQAGDRIFLFSDGYADQFGGPKGKKFKYKQMKEKIQAGLRLSLSEQKKHLDHTYEAWRGDFEQVDDVLVIGVEI